MTTYNKKSKDKIIVHSHREKLENKHRIHLSQRKVQTRAKKENEQELFVIIWMSKQSMDEKEGEREREKWPNLICLDKHAEEINEYSILTR